MAPNIRNISSKAVVNVSSTDRTRSEVRQFLVALSAFAFVVSAMGVREAGPLVFASDIVLVLCGGWCANQLIRGFDTLKEQVICVMQAYFVGLLCCSIILFLLGWLAFLPGEIQLLGQSLLHAATFTTNLQIAYLPTSEHFRFACVLDHLWLPALIAQCCAILAGLF